MTIAEKWDTVPSPGFHLLAVKTQSKTHVMLVLESGMYHLITHNTSGLVTKIGTLKTEVNNENEL
jgi:hypothetical protein